MFKNYKIIFFNKVSKRIITITPSEERASLISIKTWLRNNDSISDAVVYDTEGNYAFEYDEEKGVYTMRYDVYYFSFLDDAIHHIYAETDENFTFDMMINVIKRWPEEAVVCDEEGNEVFSKEEGRKD